MGLFFDKLEDRMTLFAVALIAGFLAILPFGIALICGAKFFVALGIYAVSYVVIAIVIVVIAAIKGEL